MLLLSVADGAGTLVKYCVKGMVAEVERIPLGMGLTRAGVGEGVGLWVGPATTMGLEVRNKRERTEKKRNMVRSRFPFEHWDSRVMIKRVV
jgi:hypothetical protein